MSGNSRKNNTNSVLSNNNSMNSYGLNTHHNLNEIGNIKITTTNYNKNSNNYMNQNDQEGNKSNNFHDKKRKTTRRFSGRVLRV